MNRTAIAAALVVTLVALSGCAQTGTFAAAHLSSVEMSEPNFKVVATGVSGESKAAYLLGFSFSNGPQSGSLAVTRIGGTGQIYKEALDNLWETFEAEHGPVAGRRLALTNIRYDADNLNLLVYSDIKLAVRADVIEFTD